MLKSALRRTRAHSSPLDAPTTTCEWKQENPHLHYKFGQELGRGKFGVTVRATCLKTGVDYAIKCITKHQPDYDPRVVQREVEILSRLSEHPNIASLHEIYEDAGHQYVVMELCSGGELFDLIVSRGYFTERECALVVRVLLQIVVACHNRGILHRDLKPENILLKERTGSIEKDNLRGAYSWEADAWSVGVILYIALSGMPPFWGRTDGEIFKRVLNEPLDLKTAPWPDVSPPAKDLVARLLNRDVKKRITARQALNHPWILAQAHLPDKPMSSVMLTRLKQFTAMSKFKVTLLNLVAKHLNPDEIGSLKESFMAMDEDGSGFLSVEELRNGLSRCSVDPRATDVGQLMKQLDLQQRRDDGGHAQSTLSYKDFLAAALDTQRNLNAQSLGAIFSALDRDGDGYLTAEELAEGLQDADIFASVDDIMQMMEQEPTVEKAERENNLHNLHRISVAAFTDIIQRSTKGELQVARLEAAARQMSAFAQSNRLKQLAALVVARTCPTEDISELREFFEELDKGKTGKIALTELQQGLRQKCSLTQSQVQEITSALDANHDGEVEYGEFLASAESQQMVLSETKMRAAFAFIDADQDGKISKDDMHNLLTELDVDHGELDAIMELADKDNDGVVSFEEFEFLMHSPVVSKPNMLNRISMQPRSVTQPQPAASQPRDIKQQQQQPRQQHTSPASPVNSLMTAMESQWMKGQLNRVATFVHGVRRHKTQ